MQGEGRIARGKMLLPGKISFHVKLDRTLDRLRREEKRGSEDEDRCIRVIWIKESYNEIPNEDRFSLWIKEGIVSPDYTSSSLGETTILDGDPLYKRAFKYAQRSVHFSLSSAYKRLSKIAIGHRKVFSFVRFSLKKKSTIERITTISYGLCKWNESVPRRVASTHKGIGQQETPCFASPFPFPSLSISSPSSAPISTPFPLTHVIAPSAYIPQMP